MKALFQNRSQLRCVRTPDPDMTLTFFFQFFLVQSFYYSSFVDDNIICNRLLEFRQIMAGNQDRYMIFPAQFYQKAADFHYAERVQTINGFI